MTNIHQISITGFRNLQPLELHFVGGKQVFAFVGKNGQGKTNILEAIYLCSLSKSFRGKTNTDLIGFSEDFCRLQVETEEEKLEVIVTRNPLQKVLKVNGVKKSASEFIGSLKTVFFSPDDLAHMAFAPKLRRRYLDVFLTQLKSEYLLDLMRYEAVRTQRNALLKKIKEGSAHREELMFWDEQLAQWGIKLLEARTELIEEIQPLVQQHYQSISESKEEVTIIYQSEMDKGLDSKAYLAHLQKVRDRDIIAGKTQWGPHVDDLSFYLFGRDMNRFASRGEWRSLVLSLKFAEIDLIRRKTLKQPILLLDDVFSELDETRQKYLFKAIGDSQTFITTTHEVFFKELKNEVFIYRIQDGQIASSF